jgi:hypothetical protein
MKKILIYGANGYRIAREVLTRKIRHACSNETRADMATSSSTANTALTFRG